MCDIQVKSIGIPDEFVEQGTQAVLRSKYGLDAEGIAKQVVTFFTNHDSLLTEITRGSLLRED
jgi:1-deoxy-D-xylulose-5-phosphate synthase